jgi:DNA invertase Pin-like site-specific DNA recombinase
MTVTAVPYYRVSTDDKDQNPERQKEIVEPWAAREGVMLLDAVIDEGTSAYKKNPFERPKFLAACERARAAKADAIVVECGDRFSRQGVKLDSWAEIELGVRYGLKLFRANKPLALHDTMAGDLTDSVNAEADRSWLVGHASKVRSGMQRKKKEGARFGRPAKPLTPMEIALVEQVRAEGRGWGTCAARVNEERKTHRIVDPKLRRRAEVSGSHVRRAFLATRPKVETVQKVQKAG